MLCGIILIEVVLTANPFMVAFANAAPPKARILKLGAAICMTGCAPASEMLTWEDIQLFEQWRCNRGRREDL